MPLWLATDPLLLASRSAVRRAVLEAAGVPVEVRPADIDERGVEARSPLQGPAAIAALLAREKALAIAPMHPSRLILGADQTLSLVGKRFAKPADLVSARAQLLSLSGRTHELYSAIAFVENGTVVFEHVGVARLTMRAFSDQFADDYLVTVGEAATASVGAYQIEGVGIQLFERIEGDYFTVLGLPLITALDFLRRDGWLQA